MELAEQKYELLCVKNILHSNLKQYFFSNKSYNLLLDGVDALKIMYEEDRNVLEHFQSEVRNITSLAQVEHLTINLNKELTLKINKLIDTHGHNEPINIHTQIGDLRRQLSYAKRMN